MSDDQTSNREIAGILNRVADLLAVQGANPFRTQAYRNAAGTVERMNGDIRDLVGPEHDDKLESLAYIGSSIAAAIREFVHTGRLQRLDRLEGQVSAEDLFTTVPGIGKKLAESIHRLLHIETLEDLEVATHDGCLSALPGFGARRLKGISNSLDVLLSYSRGRHPGRRNPGFNKPGKLETAVISELPAISDILAIDHEYRTKAQAGGLEKISTRRFNPERKPWLPVLHTERSGWHYTALFSNTVRAHELAKVWDWVVISYEKDGREYQCTVVTESRGGKRKRLVRGRENG